MAIDPRTGRPYPGPMGGPERPPMPELPGGWGSTPYPGGNTIPKGGLYQQGGQQGNVGGRLDQTPNTTIQPGAGPVPGPMGASVPPRPTGPIFPDPYGFTGGLQDNVRPPGPKPTPFDGGPTPGSGPKPTPFYGGPESDAMALMRPKGDQWRPPPPPNPLVGNQGGGGFARPPFPAVPSGGPQGAGQYTALGADPAPPQVRGGNQYNPDTRPGQEDSNAMFNAPPPPMPAGLDPYEQQVWETRRKAWEATPKANYFDQNFWNKSNTEQERFWAGLQSGKGIPAADAKKEASRYRLRGLSR